MRKDYQLVIPVAGPNSHFEMFKNHKLIKIFQKEIYEKNRAEDFLNKAKEKGRKMQIVFVRASPIMETMTGIMIAILMKGIT